MGVNNSSKGPVPDGAGPSSWNRPLVSDAPLRSVRSKRRVSSDYGARLARGFAIMEGDPDE